MTGIKPVLLVATGLIWATTGCRPPSLLKEERIQENIRSYSLDVMDLLQTRVQMDVTQVQKISFYKVNEAFPFRLENGKITLQTQLDRESVCRDPDSLLLRMCEGTCCKFLRIEVDMGSKSEEYCVKILIDDVNDNAPRFSNDISQTYMTISEAANINDVIHLPLAKDDDSSLYDIAKYEIHSATPKSGFHQHFILEDYEIPQLRPKLKLIKRLDRETISEFSFTLFAIDKGNPPKSGQVSIVLQVTDVNDVVPKIFNVQPGYIIRVNESHGSYHQRKKIAEFDVKDEDDSDNGRVQCKIESFHGDDYRAENIFEIKQKLYQTHSSPKMGVTHWVIESRGLLDYEVRRDYRFIIVASDFGKPPKSSSATLSVVLDNIDDNPIHISFWSDGKEKSRVEIDENESPQLKIARVEVKDRDLETVKDLHRITCSLHTNSDIFSLHELPPSTYNIVKEYNLETRKSFDREVKNTYEVQLKCVDNQISRTVTAMNSLMVNIRDKNDCPPVFKRKVYKGSIRENSESRTHVMMDSGNTIIADDNDKFPNNQIAYKLEGADSGIFRINTVGDLLLEGELDFEKKRKYNFTVVAYNENAPEMKSNATIIIDVIDVNDNPAKIIDFGKGYTFEVPEEVDNYIVGYINATDADTSENNRKIVFSIVDNSYRPSTRDATRHFMINKDTGELRVTKKIDREATHHFQFKVTAKNPSKLEMPRGYYGIKTMEESTTVIIKVKDANDNKPKLCRILPHHQTTCQEPPEPLYLTFKEDTNIFYNQEIKAADSRCIIFEYEIRDDDEGEASFSTRLHNLTEYIGGRSIPINDEYFVFNGNHHLFCIKYLPAKATMKQDYKLIMTITETKKPQHHRSYKCHIGVTRSNPQTASLSKGSERINSRNKSYKNNGQNVDRQSFVMIVIFVTVAVLCIVLFLAIFLFFYMKKCDAPIDKDYAEEGVAVPLNSHTTKSGGNLDNLKPEKCTLLFKGRQTEIDGDAMYECGIDGNEINIELARRRYETWCEKNKRGCATMPHTPKQVRPVAQFVPKVTGSGTLNRKVMQKFSSADDISPTQDAKLNPQEDINDAAKMERSGYQIIDPFSLLQESTNGNLPYTELQENNNTESPLKSHSCHQTNKTNSTRTSTEPLYSPKRSLKSTYFETSFV